MFTANFLFLHNGILSNLQNKKDKMLISYIFIIQWNKQVLKKKGLLFFFTIDTV